MKPWWTIRDPRERAQAKAADEKRRSNDPRRVFTRLCRKFDLQHDPRIMAALVDGKLVLSRGVYSFSMPVALCDRHYLANVLEILTRDIHPGRSGQPSTPQDRSAPAPIDLHG